MRPGTIFVKGKDDLSSMYIWLVISELRAGTVDNLWIKQNLYYLFCVDFGVVFCADKCRIIPVSVAAHK